MWTNYPNMPTGKKASVELFNDLVAFSRQHNILLVTIILTVYIEQRISQHSHF